MRTTPFLLFALVLGAAGCSDSRPYRTAAASGRVTLDGQPLADARLTFQPEHDPQAGILNGPEAHGVTDADGNYSLTTVFKDQGATIGRNRVTISTRKTQPVSADPEAKQKQVAPEKVPPKYYTAKGWLYFDVPAEGTKAANFDLTSK
jgi:hypothetical protein